MFKEANQEAYINISFEIFNMDNHLSLIEKWEAEKELYSFLSHPRPRYLRENDIEQEKKTTHYMIKLDERYIGSAWLEDITQIDAKLGVYIAEKDLRGKGIGKKTLDFLLKVGFNTYGLQNIYLNVRQKNERAINLYKKYGFAVTKENEPKLMCDGSIQSSYEMELQKSVWGCAFRGAF